MTIVHLEPEEFVKLLAITGKQPRPHVIALDNHVAGLVYTCSHGPYTYYMDRVEVATDMTDQLDMLSCQELHAQVYRKMALDIVCCGL